MTSSSSGSRTCRYDVFPSFSGEDVRKYLLSHLLKELHRRLIITFIDHSIDRGRPIGPELLLAIRESRISIVMFTKNYASSTWCLNELLEIHKSFMEFDQMVIPVFYNVDPSDVRKQTGEFGKAFGETCKGKTEDEKRRWIRALAEVANMAGEDFQNWCNEAEIIEKIANYVSNKLITPSNDCGDFIGIEAHIERLISMLRFESKEARMIGIWGPKGIGKSTIARNLYISLISRFHHRAFVSYKRTNQDDYGMRLSWEEQLLSEILRQKDIKIDKLGAVEQRLKHQKVLIVLDHVDDLELLRTLVGQIGWFGFESRVIVISKDKKLLKSHNINRVYEVDFPSEKLALQMFCRYAFGQNSPPHGFEKLAVEVAKLAGTLPSHLKKLGSSFRGMDKEEWVEKLTDLRNGLDAKIVSRYSASSTNAMPAGSANAQCSNSQPQSNMDASLGTDKLVDERTRTRNCFSKDPQSSTSVVSDSQEEEERIECGPGVYITLVAQRNGTKLLKDVSFTLREKKAQVAHTWWSENRRKTYEKYNICGSANGQCSNSQPQKHMDASPGTDTLVHDRTRIRNCFSKDPQRSTSMVNDSQVGEERIECGPGVYITLVTQRDGTKLLKDVSFTLREKKAQIAHTWWSENWRKMYEKYNICGKLHK